MVWTACSRSTTLSLMGSEEHVLLLAKRVLGASCGLADGAADAPGEVVNTIAGRLRASLEIGGINVPLK